MPGTGEWFAPMHPERCSTISCPFVCMLSSSLTPRLGHLHYPDTPGLDPGTLGSRVRRLNRVTTGSLCTSAPLCTHRHTSETMTHGPLLLSVVTSGSRANCSCKSSCATHSFESLKHPFLVLDKLLPWTLQFWAVLASRFAVVVRFSGFKTHRSASGCSKVVPKLQTYDTS